MANVVWMPGPLQIVPPGLLMFCVVIGALLLWTRTKSAAALVQLVAASLLFVDWAVFAIYQLCLRIEPFGLDPVATPEPFQAARRIVVLVALVAFPIAYVWYAFTLKASNQAMERTADRCAFHF
jgi:hypothetical protein